MIKRRDFLKLSGVTGTLLAAGCGESATRKLIPFLNPPEDIVPGRATWYATTCRQCPAGCGLLARNREARVVKLEGNPDHPVNKGRLCARGQAGLQELYAPDRLTAPLLRASGRERSLIWTEALERFRAVAADAEGRVAVISGLEDGSVSDLLDRWLRQFSPTEPLYFEPIDYADLRVGNRIVFGRDAVPAYELSGCDLILSIGAEFLETWLSPVEFSRQFAEARDPHGPDAGFLFAGPRLSLTGASADQWIELAAGAQADFAFALLAAFIETGGDSALTALEKARVASILSGMTIEDLASRAGISPDRIRSIAQRFAAAKRPFVLADGDIDVVVAANLINILAGSTADCADFSSPLAVSKLAARRDLRQMIREMTHGRYRMVVIHRTDPAITLPGFAEAMALVPFTVTIDSRPTETGAASTLVLPVHSPYESWGLYHARQGVAGLQQPVMGPVTGSKPLGEILADPSDPARDEGLVFLDYAASKFRLSPGSAPTEMVAALAKGFSERSTAEKGPQPMPNFEDYGYIPRDPAEGLTLLTYPGLRWFDGRDADKPWMLEVPDPLTMITWDGWVEVHPERAAKAGLDEGDVVRITTPYGEAEAGVHIYPGLHPSAVAVPIGTTGVNARALTGGLAAIAGIRIERTGRKVRLANVDGSSSQHGRGIARAEQEGAHGHGGAQGHHEVPLRLPVASAHDPKTDIYPAHEHDGYRWGMVIDLDKCTGCSACVAACYAENNVAVVGRERVLEGREMAWLRIERYFEAGENPGVRFIPMLCQHCDDAPCETVCPVYAPHHNREGMNVQIYNRCVGTRFCAQNCPYKVRRFNFFKYGVDSPLEMQFNPDVTVRTKGVMEKCSFCVQRIKEAHQAAKMEKRTIRDGEVVPACAQTCPTGAIVFGSFLDADSRLMRLAADGRAYQVLGELNTKPGVIYLKKIIRNNGARRT